MKDVGGGEEWGESKGKWKPLSAATSCRVPRNPAEPPRHCCWCSAQEEVAGEEKAAAEDLAI